MGTKRKHGEEEGEIAGKTDNGLTKRAPASGTELHGMLKLYYQHMFPSEPYLRWLSYGKGNGDRLWTHREFSFNSEVNGQEIYQRYKSFEDVNEFTRLLRRQVPLKIDIGAVFNKKPKLKQQIQNLEAEEKELVIDIDISDYDEVRTCCQDKQVCDKCWPIMNCAIEVLNELLTTEFGFDHKLFIFSGRRGVHCWVGDHWARKLDTNARSAFISYLSITPGKRDVNISGIPDWIERAFRICKPYFLKTSIEVQEILQTEEQILRMLEWIDFPEIRHNIGEEIQKAGAAASSSDRWTIFENVFEKHIKKKKKEPHEAMRMKYNYMELVLFCIYPRLDVEVTRHLNHLLKSPFCVHPKTGKLCIPMDTKNLDAFSPNAVPTLRSLVAELNDAINVAEKKSEITWKQIPSIVAQVKIMNSVFLDPLLDQEMEA